MTSPISFLDEFFEAIEEMNPHKKSFFDICGVSGKELVNSNVLYYFFDEYEDHNLKRVFLDSLIELYNEKASAKQETSLFDTSYFLLREHKYIDLVIFSGDEDARPPKRLPDWAIVIENKLFADLYNDLEGYLNRVEAKIKLGIVLSLRPIKLTTQNYVNILHNELLQRVKEKLVLIMEEIDTTRLILLKEYLLNVKSLTMTDDLGAMTENLSQYQREIEKIEQLHILENQLRDYVIRSTIKAFREFHFNPSNESTATWSKHFLPDAEHWSDAGGLRFWIDFSLLFVKAKYTIWLSGVLWQTRPNWRQGEKAIQRYKFAG